MEKRTKNPETLNPDGACRLRHNLTDEEKEFFVLNKTIRDNEFHPRIVGHSGIQTSLSATAEWRDTMNQAFIQEIKILISKGLLLSDDPRAIRASQILRSEIPGVITDETKEIARSLISQSHAIQSDEEKKEKKIRNSRQDRNIRVKALEIVNTMFGATGYRQSKPEQIKDKKVFFSAVEMTVNRAKGKKIRNSYVGQLIDARPEDISEKEIRNFVKFLSHNDRAETKRAIEKNKRSQYLLSAVARFFSFSHSCLEEKAKSDPKLLKRLETSARKCRKHGVRIKEKKDGNVRYLAVFCRECRTSVSFSLTFNMEKPETIAQRVKRIFGSSLAEFERSDSVANQAALSAIRKQHKSDMEIWNSRKATWKQDMETFISDMNGVQQTPEGAGLGKSISDRKHRNRIRTR